MKFSAPPILVRSIATLLAAAAGLSPARAATWNADAADVWSNGARWVGGIPDGVGAVADFSTVNITAARTVTLDSSRTVGLLRFGDTDNNQDWTLAATGGSTLTLNQDAGTTPATIAMVNRTATISAPLVGADGINITGTGTVVLSGANGNLLGPITVNPGITLTAGSATGLGALGAANFVSVLPGGTVNVNGQNLGNGKEIRIAGLGNGGIGALVNNGAAQNNALSTVVLTNNATIGGTGRFDIRNGTPLLDLAGFRLTKIGANQFSVVNGSITAGNIELNGGTFSIETAANVTGIGMISVNAGGTLGLWNNIGPFTRSLVLNGGGINELGSNGAPNIASNIVLGANATINVTPGSGGATNLSLNGNIVESGGSFGINKTAAGRLTLNGSQSYTGLLNAAAGNLTLGANSVLYTRQLAIGDGALLDTSAINGYNLGAGGTLTIGRSGGGLNDFAGFFTAGRGATITVGPNFAARTATFGNGLFLDNTNLNLDLGAGSADDTIFVNGDLLTNGINAITIRPAAAPGISNGSHTLFTYTAGFAGSAANFSIANASNYRQTFAIDALTVPGQILVNVSGAAGNLVWSGDAMSNVWNVNGATSFNSGTERFLETDLVTFDNSGAAGPVNIPGAVTPGGLTVSATRDYVFAGEGRISGPTGLEKAGSGKLTLNLLTNDFSGPVNVTGGLVAGAVLSNNGVVGSFGTGAITLDGGGLEYTGGTITSNRLITIGPVGGTLDVNERLGVLTLSTALAGTGELTKTGPGILTIGAVMGASVGNVTVTEGTLRPAGNNTLGARMVTVEAGATFDPNGQNGASTTGRPTLNISGSGMPGFAAIFNTGGGQTNSPVYGTLNLTGDASIGSFNRYDLNGGTGGLNFNGGNFTLTKVGPGEAWWAPNLGATVGTILLESGRFGVQQSNNLGDTNSFIVVNPGAELAGFSIVTNAKPVLMNGGGFINNHDANNPQTWTGGFVQNANSSLNSIFQGNYGNVAPLIFDSPTFVLGNSTLTKLNRAPVTIRNAADGTGSGSLSVYGGTVTLTAGTLVNGSGTVSIRTDGTVSLDDVGGAVTLSKNVQLFGGILANTTGDHNLNAPGQSIEIGSHGRILNNAVGSVLRLGNMLVPARGGATFGTTGDVVLTTLNGGVPAVGKLGPAFTAGQTPATTGFASWDGTRIIQTPVTYTTSNTGPVTLGNAAAGDDVLTTHTAGGAQPHNTITGSLTIGSLIAERETAVNNGALLRIGSGGLVIRANNAAGIISTTATPGQLTSGALNGELHVTLPTPFETLGQQDLRVQIADNSVGAGFRPVALVKHGPGGLTGLGIDAQGTAAIRDNLFTGGTTVNSGRIPIVSSLALGTGPVTVRDGGQVAFFAAGNAGGAFVPNNFRIAGLGTGENGGYLGALRLGGTGVPGVVAGNVALTAESRIHDQNIDNATIAGVISGAATLQKTGGNSVTFANLANTYTGVTSIGSRDLVGGVLQVTKLANGGVASSLGASGNAASNLLLQGGTLRYIGAGDSTDRLFTLGTQVAANAVVTHTIDAAGYGSLHFTNPGAIGLLPGTFRTLQLTGSLINGGGNILNGAMREHTFAPVLGDPDTGFANLTKAGHVKWVLTSNQAYGGTTAVSDGILQLGNGGASGSLGTGAVVLSNNGDLVVNRSDAFTISNPISGVAANDTEVVQIGTGETSLAGALDNSSLKLRVENGTLVLAKTSNVNVHAAALGVTVNGGTLKLGGTGDDQIFDGGTLVSTVTLNAGGTFDLNGRNEALSRIEGTGGLITNTSAGTLSTLTLGTGATLGGVSNASSLEGVRATISGNIALTKTGTGNIVLLNDANTFGGTTTVNQGTLSLGNGSTAGRLGSGTVSLGTSGTLAVNRPDNFTLTNVLSGTGTLLQAGPGTTTVNAGNTYLGATAVSRGRLVANLATGNDVLPRDSDLLLNGGTVSFRGGASGTASQTVSGRLVVAGGDILVDAGAGATTLNLPAVWTRPAGGSTDLSSLGTATINSAVANTNGIIGSATAAFATVNGSDWAAQSGANTVTSFAGYTNAFGPGAHTDFTGVAALGAATTSSTVRFNTPASNLLNLGGFTLGLEQGGVLITPALATNAVTISNGTLTGAAAAGGEVIVHQHNPSAPTIISAALANNGTFATGLTKAGAGTLILAGTNTNSGDVHVNQGVLQIGDGGTTGTLGAGSNIHTDATLAFNRADTLTVNNPIGGSGTVLQAGAGTTRLLGTNLFTGGLAISKGSISTDGNQSLGTGIVTLGDPATGSSNVALLLELGADVSNAIVVSANGSGTATIGTASSGVGTNPSIFSGGITLERATTFQGLNTDRTTYTGIISGAGAVTVRGGQRTTWEAENTFSGDVTIMDAGTVLQVGSGSFSVPRSQIPDSANVTLGDSTTLQLNGDSETIATLNSTGNAAVVTSAAGGPQVLTVTNGGNFAGRVRTGNFTLESTGGVLTLSGTQDNDTGQVLVNGGTVVLAKTSTAAVHAVAVNATVNSGTLQLGGTGGDQIWDGSTTNRTAVVLNGGQLDMNGRSEGFSILDGFGGIVTNSVAATTGVLTLGTNNWSNTSYYGAIQDGAGAVALTKVGTGGLILAGANTFTGTTTISAGLLQLGNGANSGSLASGSIINNGTLVVNRADASTVAGAISGTGRVILNGSGLTTLSGENSFSGGITVNAGGLNVVADSGLGAASGRLTLNENARLQAGGTFSSERAIGLGAGGGTLDTNGFNVTLGAGSAVVGTTLVKTGDGRLTLSGLQSYEALVGADGDTLLNSAIGAGGSTVTVGTANVDTTASQTLAALNIGAGGVFTILEAGPAAGPAAGFGAAGDPFAGYPTAAANAGAAPVQAVPEPGAVSLLAAGLLSLLGRRRIRRG